ncbi:VanW family protein [Paenibacillus sp. MBLB4367]|uniref:VanW family protein n=1 Tax=Paenibacillus sp. MBLB4367 TaxID=3384767 RepID=UPI0039082056
MKLIWIAAIMLLLQPVQPMPPSENKNDASFAVEFKGKNVASANRAGYTLPGMTMVDMKKYQRFVDTIHKKVYEPPQNAKIGSSGKIVKEQVGYELDRFAMMQHFYTYFYGSGPYSAEAPRKTVYPRVDSELLANIRVKAIGNYATYYNSSNKNRSNNIAIASKALDNQVVFPGETFSFNRAIGKRTLDKGYMKAPVIVRGELSEGIGGGICQVSSTLYNAIDRAGLKIVQRYSHSKSVPYVLPGRDATVSWDGPDFVFLNQYNQPILIRAFAGSGTMYVSVHSSDVIDYKPRVIPSMSTELPEEVSTETNAASP